MSHVITLWLLVAAASLMLAVIHALIWLYDRQARANLAFAMVSLGLAGIVWVELGMMYSPTADEWGQWVRWYQVPHLVHIVAMLAFVRLYFGTGRLWLMWTIIGLRLLILLVNFAIPPNFNFQRIDTVNRIYFLGEPVTVVGQAVPAPWQWIATITTILYLLFVFDAAHALWRRHTSDARRKAMVVGGSILGAGAIAILNSQLVIWGVWKMPTLISPPFLLTVAAMALELSRQTLRASRLARELSQSESRLELAAQAGGLGLWSWDAQRDRIWGTDRALAMSQHASTRAATREQLIAMIHADDTAVVFEACRQVVTSDQEQEVQFRICTRKGAIRWLLARGRSERDVHGRVTRVQGVLRDVTAQHQTQAEMDELRRHLAHAGRVTVLGQLSAALAHELRQPLAAILYNAEAAKKLLDGSSPNLQELRDIVVDILRDDQRAAHVIDRLRALLKRKQMEFQPIAVDSLVQDVMPLVRSDAIARAVILVTSIEPGLPVVSGDRVHLSQVLINLIVNAMDAVADLPRERRRVYVRARRVDGGVEIAVADCGTGISADAMAKIFQPFFTTKVSGIGMGLCVSRSIIEAHGGRLEVRDNENQGAIFYFSLSAFHWDSDVSGPTEREVQSLAHPWR
jgi:two-component system, LuxR family, sensor kinase FixL